LLAARGPAASFDWAAFWLRATAVAFLVALPLARAAYPLQLGFGFDEMLREQEMAHPPSMVERATLISDGNSPKEALSDRLGL
jgi:hypothetical protein